MPQHKEVGANPSDISMNQSMDQQILTTGEMTMREIWHQKPCHDLLYSTDVVPVPGLYSGNIPAYLHDMREDLKSGEEHEAVIMLGPAGVGKTTISQQIAHWDYYGMDQEDTGTLNPETLMSIMDWGQSFIYIPPGLRLSDKINYNETEALRQQKRAEVQLAAHIWSSAFQHIFEGYFKHKLLGENHQRERFQQVIFADHVGPSGMGSLIGIDRGVRQLHDLVHHKGKFENQKYGLRFVVVTAPSDLLESNRETRAALRRRKKGVEFVADNPDMRTMAKEHYLNEAASQKEISLLEQDIAEYRHWRNQKLGLSPDLPEVDQQVAFMVDFLTSILSIPPSVAERSIVLQNNRRLDKVVFPAVLTHRPLDDLLPVLEEEIPQLRS